MKQIFALFLMLQFIACLNDSGYNKINGTWEYNRSYYIGTSDTISKSDNDLLNLRIIFSKNGNFQSIIDDSLVSTGLFSLRTNWLVINRKGKATSDTAEILQLDRSFLQLKIDSFMIMELRKVTD